MNILKCVIHAMPPFIQFMFHIQNNNSLLQGKRQPYDTTSTSLQKKNGQFRKDIRRKQIEQKMKVMRQQILASLSQDYHILKNIDLNEVFHHFMKINEHEVSSNWKDIENLANDIFIYSRSDQSDHLYCMFDEKVIHKLISLLQIENIPSYKQNPRTYIRILWILANYTSYSSERLQKYQAILFTLFNQITSVSEFYTSKNEYKIFTHSQVKQIIEIILFSIHHQTLNASYLMNICLNAIQSGCFINIMIQEFQKLIVFTKNNSIKDTFIPSILSKILNIFENALKFKDQDSNIMNKMYQLDFKIVNILLQLLVLLNREEKQVSIQYQITIIIRQYLYSHLHTKPQIIISHNFIILFKMIASITQKLISTSFQITHYDDLLDVEGQTKTSMSNLKKKGDQLQRRANQVLQGFIIIFGLNFPQDSSEKYYDIYYSWIEDELIPVFRQIFKPNYNGFDQIRFKCLQIIRNACLEEEFCQLIIEELSIMHQVFYCIHSQSAGIRLKKSALGVLNSIICISLEGESNLRMQVVQMLGNNKIVEIFVRFIGQYVDEELNMNLLQSFLLYLATETAEEPQDHSIWMHFCRQDGIYKLEKYYNNVKNEQIQNLIETILKEYKA